MDENTNEEVSDFLEASMETIMGAIKFHESEHIRPNVRIELREGLSSILLLSKDDKIELLKDLYDEDKSITLLNVFKYISLELYEEINDIMYPIEEEVIDIIFMGEYEKYRTTMERCEAVYETLPDYIGVVHKYAINNFQYPFDIEIESPLTAELVNTVTFFISGERDGDINIDAYKKLIKTHTTD